MSAQTTIARLREHNEELLESLGKAYGDISEAVRQREERGVQIAELRADIVAAGEENERLRDELDAAKARLTLTPEKVEAALTTYYRSWPTAQVGYTEEGRRDMRAALLAAGFTEAQP